MVPLADDWKNSMITLASGVRFREEQMACELYLVGNALVA